MLRRQIRTPQIDCFLTFEECHRTKCVAHMIALRMVWGKKKKHLVCSTYSLTSMSSTLNEQRTTSNKCLRAERQQFQYLQICAIQGFYVAQNGGFFVTFRDKKDWWTFKDGTNRVSRNGGKNVPFYDVQNPKRVHIPFTPRRKPEIICSSSTFFKYGE